MISEKALERLSRMFDESAVKARAMVDVCTVFKNLANVSSDQELVKVAKEAIKAEREYASLFEEIALVFIRDQANQNE